MQLCMARQCQVLFISPLHQLGRRIHTIQLLHMEYMHHLHPGNTIQFHQRILQLQCRTNSLTTGHQWPVLAHLTSKTTLSAILPTLQTRSARSLNVKIHVHQLDWAESLWMDLMTCQASAPHPRLRPLVWIEFHPPKTLLITSHEPSVPLRSSLRVSM